jgi:hypothetical protein
MLIKLFRKESVLQFIILLLLGFILWLPAFIHPLTSPAPWSPVPLYEKIIGLLGPSGYLNTSFALVLVIAEGILLTLLLSGHDLSPRNNLHPAILYMIFLSWNPEMLRVHPALITNGVLLLFMYFFLKIYEKPDAYTEVFSACFTLAVACCFDLPVGILLLLVWLGFMVYRIFSWHEWSISMIGFCLPLLYIVFYYYWMDQLPDFLHKTQYYISQLKFVDYKTDPVTFIILIIISILVFASILKVINSIQEKVISIRKKFLFVVWFFILTVPIFLFSDESRWLQGSISFLPATALVNFHFTSLKKLFWWEILFTVFILGLLWIRIF